MLVDHPLMVDQLAFFTHQPAQERHIVRLSLDRMGKEHVRLARHDQIDGNFFDRQDGGTRREILGDNRTGAAIRLIRKYANVGGLDDHLDAMPVSEHGHVFRNQRYAPFPSAFVFPPNADSILPAIYHLGLPPIHRPPAQFGLSK